MYNDCWTYPREVIDEKIRQASINPIDVLKNLKTVTFEYTQKTTFTEGETGFVDITVTGIDSSNTIVSINPYVSHLSYGINLTGGFSADKKHLYLGFYAPVAFTKEGFKISADIVYY